ncbi:hypothetical protein VMHJH2_09495 [Streptococcus uberis]|uniref:hypothetical protein n=1 Tax=Streptococcus uberis TaxID=1349 RepID=UPI00214FA496|nr:hypothetical protein [Streptococcus uberis]MCR4258753.1 hypothetical protein [Streptococcus uberis]
MTPKIEFGKWYEDEAIDSVFIDFTGISGGYGGYDDIPDDIKTMVFRTYQKKSGEGLVNYAEVINPEPFLNSEFADTYEINGYNVKKLIIDAYNAQLENN